jgi:membrane protein YqaA with SNARE-associated domain
MNADWFVILMVIALGSMTGAAIGLGIGFALGKQKSEWSAMTKNEKLINIALVTLCSVICSAGLAWYAFIRPPG